MTSRLTIHMVANLIIALVAVVHRQPDSSSRALLSPAAWTSTDSLGLLACGGYMVVCATIGIRWFKWDAR